MSFATPRVCRRTDPAGNHWTTPTTCATDQHHRSGQGHVDLDLRRRRSAADHHGRPRHDPRVHLRQPGSQDRRVRHDQRHETRRLDLRHPRQGRPTSATRYRRRRPYTTRHRLRRRLPPAGHTDHAPAPKLARAAPTQRSAPTTSTGHPPPRPIPRGRRAPAETVTTTYDHHRLPATLTGLDTYVATHQYYYDGGVKQQLLGSGTKQVKPHHHVDEATGRLTKTSPTPRPRRTPTPGTSNSPRRYTYDPAGNVTGIAETTRRHRGPTSASPTTGCNNSPRPGPPPPAACQATPSQAIVGGPDPYWIATATTPAGDRPDASTTRAATPPRIYTYRRGRRRPHTRSPQSTTTGAAAPRTNPTATTPAGNTTTRTIAGRRRPDPDLGRRRPPRHRHQRPATPATSTTPTATASSATTPTGTHPLPRRHRNPQDRDRRRQPPPATTGNGRHRAPRTDGLTWLAATTTAPAELAINAGTLSRHPPPHRPVRRHPRRRPDRLARRPGLRRRHHRPSTGLTHLGAREYDPPLGRFISVDPVLDMRTRSR